MKTFTKKQQEYVDRLEKLVEESKESMAELLEETEKAERETKSVIEGLRDCLSDKGGKLDKAKRAIEDACTLLQVETARKFPVKTVGEVCPCGKTKTDAHHFDHYGDPEYIFLTEVNQILMEGKDAGSSYDPYAPTFSRNY